MNDKGTEFQVSLIKLIITINIINKTLKNVFNCMQHVDNELKNAG